MGGDSEQSQEGLQEGVAQIDRYVVELSPLRVVSASAAVILVFAFLFPLVGAIANPVTGAQVGGFDGTVLLDSPSFYIGIVLSTSLHLSVQTFTTVGSHLRPTGAAQYLVDLESLLGVALLGLLWASLIRS